MVKLALEGAFAIGCAGFCAATVTVFLALMRGDFFTTCFVICAIVGSVFAVITWTTSFVVLSVRLSPPSVAGANACARAPALEMTRTDVVVKAKQASRFPTEARLCRESQVKASFFLKKKARRQVIAAKSSFHRSPFGNPNRRENNRAQIRAED